MCTTLCSMSDYTPPILRRAPLQSMVCELRFPTRLAIQDDATRLQQALAEDYPLVETQAGLMLQMQGVPLSSTRYMFVSRDQSHAVLFTQTTLGLECRTGYEGWKAFCAKWERVVSALLDNFGGHVFQQRIGLRYINQIKAIAAEGLRGMEGRVNPALLQPLGDDSELFQQINSSMQELRVAQEFGVCTVRHGLQVSDDGEAAYILDFDYYSDEMTPLDLPAQIELLNRFNLGVWKLFRWSLSDEQYESFEPEDRE